MRTEWCISPNGGQMKPASNNRPPNTHRLADNINWTFFIIFLSFFSPRGPHEMRDLVGRAEALSALTTTVGQCTKLPNARTKVHNAIAVMSWKCFIESGNWTASLLDRSFHSLLDRSYLAYARTIFSLHSLSDRWVSQPVVFYPSGSPKIYWFLGRAETAVTLTTTGSLVNVTRLSNASAAGH